MSRLRDDLFRSVLAGASTGGRTFTAIEALALSAPPASTTGPSGRLTQPDATLAKPWVRGVLGVLALGELASDKLPIAPSRLEAPGLVGRLVFGGLCGATIARRAPDHRDRDDTTARTIACVVTGVATAGGAAWLGVRWRARAKSVFGRDWIGAELEDAAVGTLAAAAARAR